MSKLETFEEIWAAGAAGCVNTCHCGKTYYDRANSYDWEDGEFEELEADLSIIALEHAVTLLDLDGQLYVMDCECWHDKAERIMNWLDANAERIGNYFRLEKIRRIAEAENLPIDITFAFQARFCLNFGSFPRNSENLFSCNPRQNDRRARRVKCPFSIKSNFCAKAFDFLYGNFFRLSFGVFDGF